MKVCVLFSCVLILYIYCTKMYILYMVVYMSALYLCHMVITGTRRLDPIRLKPLFPQSWISLNVSPPLKYVYWTPIFPQSWISLNLFTPLNTCIKHKGKKHMAAKSQALGVWIPFFHKVEFLSPPLKYVNKIEIQLCGKRVVQTSGACELMVMRITIYSVKMWTRKGQLWH